MSEFEYIAALQSQLPSTHRQLIHGMGDDAAVLKQFTYQPLMSVDTLNEGVHFCAAWASWTDIAYKAIQVNVSDIAAMGGCPQFFCLSLSLPPSFKQKSFKQLLRGLNQACDEHKLVCIGGDTTRSHEGVQLSITMLGKPGKKILYRYGAQAQDDIYVSGFPGMSALGLCLLKQKQVSLRGAKSFIRQHHRPQARVALAKGLAKMNIHAMIDVSDGVLADLNHVLQASQVGAIIESTSLRASQNFQRLAATLGQDFESLLWTGGEDYELLFCAPPQEASKIARLSQRLRLPLTRIGQIQGQPGLQFIGAHGERKSFKKLGFDHFG